VTGSARESVGDAAHRAQEGVHHAVERAGDVPDMVRYKTEGNPLAVGLVAFGLGLVAATLLPESSRERRLARQLQPQLEDAARTAAETGRTIAEDLKPSLQQSAEHVQESARESVGNVTEEAKSAAQHVTEEGKQAAANVKDTAGRR